ncbi:MAG: cysteine dioxygenase family protein [Cyclobacteriaceae bacterium]|nr:cysteine dioxygenase family protein [Cyclobacteriaceae bacterium]
MKALINHHTDEDFTLTKSSVSHRAIMRLNREPDADYYPLKPNVGHKELLTAKAMYQMSLGQIPDLWEVCFDLYTTFFSKTGPYTAMQFVPVLKKLISISKLDLGQFLKNPDTNHVLIQNELLKVVLIHWEPGKFSNIHGHPKGGCVFKVLHGSIEEKRYTTETSPKLLAVSTYQKDAMGYIDDQMAYHAVGNPFNTPAISLHAYTPGLKKTNSR